MIPLGPGEILAITLRGLHMVVPSWNLDVGPGIIRDGVIEPWTNEVLLSVLREGDCFVNVGANFGYYSLLGAQRVGRLGSVYAIEANPYVFLYLVKSAFWSGFPHVIRMFNAAAAAPEQHGKKVEFVFRSTVYRGRRHGEYLELRVSTLCRGLLDRREHRRNAQRQPTIYDEKPVLQNRGGVPRGRQFDPRECRRSTRC